MIFSDSRYIDGTLFKANDARDGSYQLTVFRAWPTYKERFYFYEVVETDRIANLSVKFLGHANLWYKIMDLNPEVLDPFSLKPGTLLRIPYE
jgi:hypothetical protein